MNIKMYNYNFALAIHMEENTNFTKTHPLDKDYLIPSLHSQNMSHNKITQSAQSNRYIYNDEKISNTKNANNLNHLSSSQKNNKKFKQVITFIKSKLDNAQFIAYCVVEKESVSGFIFHQRLLLLDSHTKQLKYFSQVPNLPIRTLDELGKAKQVINLNKVQNCTCIYKKNTIGQIEIAWKEFRQQKQWYIRMGNIRIAKQFCLLVDLVKNNKYFKDKNVENSRSSIKPQPNQGIKIIKQPQVKQINTESNQKQSMKQQQQKIEIIVKNEKNQEKLIEQVQDEKYNDQQQVKPISSQVKLRQTQSIELIAVTPTNSHHQSLKSLSIRQIVQQINRQNDIPSIAIVRSSYFIENKKLNQPKLSELQKILQNRRTIDHVGQESTTQIKDMNKDKAKKSKDLVSKFQRQTNKQKIDNSKFKNIFHQTMKNPHSNRQSLLQQRRHTEIKNDKKQAKTFILNQHTQSRRQKSLPQSKGFLSNRQKVNPEIDWLVNWLKAGDRNERMQIYSRFIDHCQKRVHKLAQSFINWHLFHKDLGQYIIKQQNIEFSYHLISKDQLSIIQEESIIAKYRYFDAIWKIINQFLIIDKVRIPLMCLISYKGLKVFCKVQLTSDCLKIQQAKEYQTYQKQLNLLQEVSKGTLKYLSLFEVISNNNKWLYINDIQFDLSLSSIGYQVNTSYIMTEVKENEVYNPERVLQHLKRTVIPSFINQLSNSPTLTPNDFQQMLNKYHLNSTLLKLVYQKSIQMNSIGVTSLVISQICAYVMEQEVRQQMHNFLLYEKSGHKFDDEIYNILTKVLRWGRQCYLDTRLKNIIGVSLNAIKQFIIKQYTISSLLSKLSLNCKLKNIPPLTDLEQYKFSFWEDYFQFQPQFIQISCQYTYFIYDFHYFSDHSDQIQKIVEEIFKFKFTPQLLSKIVRKICPHKDYKESSLFRLLPQSIQHKINQLETYLNPISIQANIKKSKDNVTAYQSISCFKFRIATIKALIKSSNFRDIMQLINTELQRAWIWSRFFPSAIISLYDLATNTALSLHSLTTIQNIMKCLRVSLTLYEQGQLQIVTLMHKVYKAGQINCIFDLLDESANLYSAAQQIYQSMIVEGNVESKYIICYMKIYSSHLMILVNQGKYEQSVVKIKSNLKLFNKWKDGLQNMNYQIMAQIHAQQYENYTLLCRCYELMHRKAEMMYLIAQMSIKFIENYLKIMMKNINKIDMSYISSRKLVQITKIIWNIIVSNCVNTQITYQQYFSQIHSNLKSIQLQSIKGITLALIAQQEQNNHNQFTNVVERLLKHIVQLLPHNRIEELLLNKTHSIFLSECIKCLQTLSSPYFLDPENQQNEMANKRYLQFYSDMVSIMGNDYTLGMLDFYLNDNTSQT